MRLEYKRGSELDNKGASAIHITHDGVELVFQVKFLGASKKNDIEGTNSFDPINAIVSRWTRERQDAIFALYSKAFTVITTSTSVGSLNAGTRAVVNEFAKHLDLFEIREWFLRYSDLHIPDSVNKDTHDNLESKWTPELTYLKDDYIDLVALVLAFRFILPIWGEYIVAGCDDKENFDPKWKAFYALRLLSRTHLYQSNAMGRLFKYVEASIKKDMPVDSAIMFGVSTEDTVEWVSSLLILTRLSVGDVRGREDTINLIACMYSFIRTKLANLSTTMNGEVKHKLEATNGAEESKISKYESFRSATELSIGDVATIDHFLNPYKVLGRMRPNIPQEVIAEAIAEFINIDYVDLLDSQMTLIKWVLGSEFKGKTIQYASIDKQYIAMLIAQIILWHDGYKDLSILVSARTRSQQGISMATVPITTALKNEIKRLYPYPKRGCSKQQAAQNQALSIINEIANELSSRTWYTTVPDSWLKELKGSVNRSYAPPADLRIQLSQFIITIA